LLNGSTKKSRLALNYGAHEFPLYSIYGNSCARVFDITIQKPCIINFDYIVIIVNVFDITIQKNHAVQLPNKPRNGCND